ncbi:uncharacterized protein PV06_03970 [Exophiala oligosperma]|uniref:Ubiquitin-like protein ATG12 n=1 Tax=Exophiala oligosperma TaxID=215243 RepID=A0A0D2B0I5_9EURO|nr:uncharacterized protein PV06_03970 [Exophiala oligosperma]KIW45591.1 hypothetical protein PV06_03970 [Exophiala oligosperma]
MESPSLPRRSSRTTASQDKQARQELQGDVNMDLERANRVEQANVPEGDGVGVGVGVGVRGRVSAATTKRAKRQQDGDDDDDEGADNDGDDGDDDDDDDEDDEDEEKGDLPMSMTASVILTNLPKDASEALKEVEELDDKKISIRFQPLGSAPILKQRVFKISASSKFSVVLNFLRKKIGAKPGDGLFLYVNSVFAPGLDESVGNLFRCFKTDDQLIVSYSTTPAFG